MTERLEEILNDLPYSIRHSGEIEELKEFAREQVERVEELEKENRLLRFIAEENKIAYEQRAKQNKRYREALEFYADEENYEFETIVSDCDIEVVSKVLDDYGQKARNALEREG